MIVVPFHGSRIIDLSEGAAKAIDMTKKKGTAKVKLTDCISWWQYL